MTLAASLAQRPDRCSHGFALVHHPSFCNCSEMGEWAIFVAALRKARRDDGTVHQADMRPLIRGRIEPKSIGQQYKRAIREGLISEVAREKSNDEIGRNTNKWEPIYKHAAVRAA